MNVPRKNDFAPTFPQTGPLSALARGAAIALGSFTLLNLLGDLKTPGFDANAWWINLSFLPHTFQIILLATSGTLLLAHGVRPFTSRTGRIFLRGIILLLAVIAAGNAGKFWSLASAGQIAPGFKIPFSAFLCAALLFLLLSTRTRAAAAQAPPKSLRTISLILLAIFLCAILFPVAQMICFGKTDYRRPADVIVIFGARAYADGRLSPALEDRVRTGCDLYRAGLAPYILMTGGPADGDMHEVDAMRARAIQLGVPSEAILLDREGLNTDASVKDTAPVFIARNMHRILAVSHFYHLPRIKMTYQRAAAQNAIAQQPTFAIYTVPAEEPYPLRALPRYMLREILALWAYYLRPLTNTP